MLKVQALGKDFGTKPILKNISFSVDRGQIVGVIGPNGSGKTTLLNILSGMILPTTGSYEMDLGVKAGISISRMGFFEDMTTMKNIQLYANLTGVSKEDIEGLCKQFSIDYQDVLYKKLSAGMKQRISLLFTFLTKPDLIFLDEPSNHLDVDSIIFLRDLLLKIRNEGKSVLLTSHILSDLEKVCDRILILKGGRVIYDDTKDSLLLQYGTIEKGYLHVFKNN